MTVYKHLYGIFTFHLYMNSKFFLFIFYSNNLRVFSQSDSIYTYSTVTRSNENDANFESSKTKSNQSSKIYGFDGEKNIGKIVENDQKRVKSDEKSIKNDDELVALDVKSVKNDEKWVGLDEKDTHDDEKRKGFDQGSIKNDMKSKELDQKMVELDVSGLEFERNNSKNNEKTEESAQVSPENNNKNVGFYPRRIENDVRIIGNDNEEILMQKNTDYTDCTSKKCFRKCCSLDQEFKSYELNEKCTQNLQFFHTNYSNTSHFGNIIKSIPKYYSANEEIDNKVTIIYGMPCQDSAKILLDPETNDFDNFSLTENLTLLWNENEYDTSKYCFERFNDNETDQVLPYVCLTEEKEDFRQIFTFVGIIISIPFLFVTVAVYISFDELQNLHGKSLICHSTSLLIAYIFLAVIKFDISHWTELCYASAFLVQFAFLASFFWMNVMCFDLWWTFSGCRRQNNSTKNNGKKKFVMYSFYGWGCPLVVSSITIFFEFFNPLPNDNTLKPDIDESTCWFKESTRIPVLVFFYGPAALTILANLAMFISTFIVIVRHNRNANVLKRQGSRRHNTSDQQRFYIYLKLFIIMGLNWSTEVLSWIMDGSNYLWFAADLGNTLQGVLIFVIFVCKKRVLALIKNSISKNEIIQTNKFTNNVSTINLNSTSSVTLDENFIQLSSV